MAEALAMPDEVLRVSGLHAWYGESHVLHGVDFAVHKGEVVTLLGRNGAGRTSTLKSILGLVGRRTGSIMVNGVETIGLPTYKIAHLGIGYCPEERGIFSSLSVEENLLLPPMVGTGGMSVEEIYEMFPNLRERRKTAQGTRLSGGEQQMLAMARILRTGARIHDRAGRAEFPVRGTTRGPALRDGTRAHRRGLCGFPARGQDRDAARVSGCVVQL